MALIPTIGPYLLPRVMPKLRKALPHLSLMLYEYQTESFAEAVAATAKSILDSWRSRAEQDGIESRVLYEEDSPLRCRTIIRSSPIRPSRCRI